MNRKIADTSGKIIGSDLLDLRAEALDDLEVCGIIDGFCKDEGAKTYAHLSPDSIKKITRILKLKGCMDDQIRRCLWT